LKVLIITGTLNNIEAGPYWSVHGLIEEMLHKGIEITLVGSYESQFSMEGNIYMALRENSPNFELKMFKKFGLKNTEFIPGILPFLLKKHQFDAIIIQGPWIWSGWVAFAYSKLFNIPTILTMRGEFMNFDSVRKLRKRPFLPWVKYMLKNISILHFLNHKEARVINKIGIKTPKIIIPNGINQNELSFSNTNKKDFIYIGRLTEGKNIINLIKAWKMVNVNGNRLLIAGTGKENYLNQIILEIGESTDIVLVGKKNADEKICFMNNAGWFILPSLREGMPMAALEAMSHGLGCILSSECNLSEFTENNAAIKTSLDAEGIKCAIEEAVNMSRTQKEIMLSNSQKLIETTYNWPRIATKFIHLLEDLTKKR
jgi:glycosyltransferase involved in cell wall biosynthesis